MRHDESTFEVPKLDLLRGSKFAITPSTERWHKALPKDLLERVEAVNWRLWGDDDAKRLLAFSRPIYASEVAWGQQFNLGQRAMGDLDIAIEVADGSKRQLVLHVIGATMVHYEPFDCLSTAGDRFVYETLLVSYQQILVDPVEVEAEGA